MSGEQIDLSSEDPRFAERPRAEPAGRPFVGVRFACCEIYTRIYINRTATAYEGNCPRCAKRIELRIGSGGTDARFFVAE